MDEATSTNPASAREPSHPAALPRHIAIIMDGNGRWAARQGRSRSFGHRVGAKAVRSIVTECARLGIEVLTLYSFSLENWKRPKEEVDALMTLYLDYLVAEEREMNENNIRLVQLGRREGLPTEVAEQLDRTMTSTAGNTGMTLCVALNYGSRAEITDAVRAIAAQVRSGRLTPDAIDERLIESHLYTAGLPDPDLLIRTSGEYRLSNYLLWQISYAELWVTDVHWPEFGVEHLHEAIRSFATRRRRFGGVDDAT
jgi:undecaprenyl diphosphate synthase